MFENLLGWWLAQSRQRRQSYVALAGVLVVVGGFLLAVRSPVSSLLDAGRPLDMRPGQVSPRAGDQAVPPESAAAAESESSGVPSANASGGRGPAGPVLGAGGQSGARGGSVPLVESGTVPQTLGPPAPTVEPTTSPTVIETTPSTAPPTTAPPSVSTTHASTTSSPTTPSTAPPSSTTRTSATTPSTTPSTAPPSTAIAAT